MNKRIQKKKRIGKFKELGILLEVSFINDIDVDEIFDEYFEFIDQHNWTTGGGGSNKSMNQFMTRMDWDGDRRIAQQSMDANDKQELVNWLMSKKWTKIITTCELRDANHGWK